MAYGCRVVMVNNVPVGDEYFHIRLNLGYSNVYEALY